MSTWRPLTTAVTAQAETSGRMLPRRRRSGCQVQRPRVAGRVDLAQPVDGDQRVDLRRRHRGVAEQFLDDADVGAAVEQVGGEGVPQRVRRDLRRSTPAPRSAADRRIDQALCRDSGPPRTLRNSAPPRTPARPVGRQRRPGPHQVVLDGPQRVAADRDDPLLAALAGQPHRRLPAVEVVDGQPDRLGDARAGAVEQLQQRPVAQPARPLDRAGRLDQRHHRLHRAPPWAAAGPASAAAPRAATSSVTSPSSSANRCSPRTATTARAADVADSGGWSSSPCRSAARKPATSDSATSRSPRTPAAARYSA